MITVSKIAIWVINLKYDLNLPWQNDFLIFAQTGALIKSAEIVIDWRISKWNPAEIEHTLLERHEGCCSIVLGAKGLVFEQFSARLTHLTIQ